MSSQKEEKEDSGFGWFSMGVAAVLGAGIGALLASDSRPQCNASSSGTSNGANSRSSEAYRNRPTPICEPCGICMDDVLLVVKLPCGHRFHASCVKKWIAKERACPMCRQETSLTQLKYSV